MAEQQLNRNISSEQDKLLNDEMKIDLMDIFRKVISIRKTLYKVAVVGLVIGIIISLSIPKQYTVRVTLSPEMGGNKGDGGIAGFAASFLGGGISPNDGVGALNVSLASDIVSSTPFLMELLSINIPVSDANNPKTLNSYLDEQSSPWWNYIIGLPSMVISEVKLLLTDEMDEITESKKKGTILELAREESNKIKTLRSSISAVINKKTAITNISVTLQSPQIAAVVADSVVHKLQEYIIGYRTSKAKEDCAYLEKLFEERKQEYYVTQKKYAEYIDTHDNLILQSVRAEQERLQNDMSLAYQVYSQVANQLQVARAEVQEKKPVFAVVEPAVVPLEPSGISKKVYILLSIFSVVLFSMGWILIGKVLWEHLKNEISNNN